MVIPKQEVIIFVISCLTGIGANRKSQYHGFKINIKVQNIYQELLMVIRT